MENNMKEKHTIGKDKFNMKESARYVMPMSTNYIRELTNDEYVELDCLLKRYLVFVIKCFKSTKEVTKDRVFHLSVEWLKDYLR